MVPKNPPACGYMGLTQRTVVCILSRISQFKEYKTKKIRLEELIDFQKVTNTVKQILGVWNKYLYMTAKSK